MAAHLADAEAPRTLRYFCSDREQLAVNRIGGALETLAECSKGTLIVARERRAANADLIWLNTPSKAHKAACASVPYYNHVIGARQALEHKGRFSDLGERMGEACLWSRAFAHVKDLRNFVAAEHEHLRGAWVVKDATANSGAGLWFAASAEDLQQVCFHVDARTEVVLQQYLERPVLWEGRKLQYRCYCAWKGRTCYLYCGAMAQVCALKYEAPVSGDAMSLETHVTNVSCNVESARFVPERPITDVRHTYPAAFAAVLRALRSLARSCAPALAPAQNRFELVGVDVLLEEEEGSLKAHLIECNCPPNAYGSAAKGPVEEFHHNVMVSLLSLCVLDVPSKAWVAVDDVSAPATAFSTALGPALAWRRFRAAAKLAASVAERPPQASAAIALQARSHFAFFDDANRWAFLENGGGTQVPRHVVQASCNALQARWRDERGAAAREACRVFASKWLRCDTLFLAANASCALSSIGACLPEGAVILTDAAHDALLRPWARREVRWWRCDRHGALDLAELTPLLDDLIRMVCVPAASNVSGRVYDIEAIIETVRAACPQAFVVVDAVAYAPHRRPIFDADAVVVAFHKCFGPHLACCAVSQRFVDAVDASMLPSPNYFPHGRAWERGTLSHEACAGGAALQAYMDTYGSIDAFYESARLAEAAPFRRLLAFLRAAPRVTVLEAFGSVQPLPTVAFVHVALAPAIIVARARAHDVAIRCGDFLSPGLLAAAGLESVVRASLVHYNTVAEVDRLCACLERMGEW